MGHTISPLRIPLCTFDRYHLPLQPAAHPPFQDDAILIHLFFQPLHVVPTSLHGLRKCLKGLRRLACSANELVKHLQRRLIGVFFSPRSWGLTKTNRPFPFPDERDAHFRGLTVQIL